MIYIYIYIDTLCFRKITEENISRFQNHLKKYYFLYIIATIFFF